MYALLVAQLMQIEQHPGAERGVDVDCINHESL
jgi:hypothetical protein